MKRYIRCAFMFTYEDHIYAWENGLRGKDLPRLSEILADYPIGTYIQLTTKTYSGYFYGGTVEILDNGCLVTTTYKNKAEPQKQLSFDETADELRRLYLFAQGRRGTSFKIEIKYSDEYGYPDVFYV